MHPTDPVTGERTRVYLFVATLPYSQYSYVEGTLDMRENTWLTCHARAFEFFGGVPARCACDNLKTDVVSHPRDGEVVLNEAYEALGRHFMCAIMPAHVRIPSLMSQGEALTKTLWARRRGHANTAAESTARTSPRDVPGGTLTTMPRTSAVIVDVHMKK